MYTTITKRRSVHVVILVALLAVTAMILNIGRSAGSYEASTEFDSSTVLLVTGRDHLAVCIDTPNEPSVDFQETRAILDAAVMVATDHDQWAAAGLAAEPHSIDIGCPTEPYLLRPEVSFVTASGKTTGSLRSIAPGQVSEYRLFIFVLDQNQMNELFKDQENLSVGFAPQEALCAGEICSEVSTGIYVSLNLLQNTDLLSKAINQGLGLEPRFNEKQSDEPTR